MEENINQYLSVQLLIIVNNLRIQLSVDVLCKLMKCLLKIERRLTCYINCLGVGVVSIPFLWGGT
jgi:hypothetical protein